ncbi:hypothetical protein AYI68_g4819 [Smittium mucronatum]|uniref:Uncharacterized protein n=1 Tax=Smittium mucronatum TaxID=133383 RepID=A0A1R0GVZ1_9FUNG|nr:hypothetical protein AYI68_g4819 [Smittium mucronatum]
MTDRKNEDIHHLPFYIQHDGDCNTESYFKVSNSDSPDEKRIIIEDELKISEEFQENIDMENMSIGKDGIESPKWVVKQNIKDWIEWAPEIEPNGQDPSISALSWLKLAELVC